MMRRLHHRLVPIVLGTVLAMSSCVSNAEPTISTLPTKTVPTSFADLSYASPIDSFLGLAAGDDAVTENELTVGRLTAECMRRSGFEYSPPAVEPAPSFRAAGSELALYSDAWVATYGFGVSTQRFRQSLVGPNLVGYPDRLDEPAAPARDPNQDYMDRLSPDERNAFIAALYGQAMVYEQGEPIAGEAGCLEQAAAAVFDTAAQSRFYDDFGDELQNLRQRVEADPRLVDHRQSVADCVVNNGYEWAPNEDPNLRFGKLLAGIGPDYYNYPGDEALSAEDLAVLAEVQAQEVEVAGVVVGCGGGYLNEQFVFGQIQREYEQRFLDENVSRLGPYRTN